MNLYDLQALLHVVIALMGYGAIAIYIAPRFSADGSRLWVCVVQWSAITFFVGCSIHHLFMAYHLMVAPEPWMIAWHHVITQVMQAIAAPVFLFSTTYIGQIRITSKTQDAEMVRE